MFSPIGAPKEDQENIDWLDDLKFFIDNDDTMLNKYFFPAVKKHKEYIGHPKAYKIYVRAINLCKDAYCDKFKIEDQDDKFSAEKIEELARKCAEQQNKFLENGDYDEAF